MNLAKVVDSPMWKEQLLQRWLENAEYSVSLLPGLWESCVPGVAGKKDRVNRAAQDGLVCTAVSWLTSEGSEMERDRKQVVELKKVAALAEW